MTRIALFNHDLANNYIFLLSPHRAIHFNITRSVKINAWVKNDRFFFIGLQFRFFNESKCVKHRVTCIYFIKQLKACFTY